MAFNDLKNKKLIFFSLFVLLFSVIRGLVPLIAQNGSLANPTYNLSYFLGFLLAGYGFYRAFFFSRQIMKREIRYLLIMNFFLTIYWVFPLIIFIPSTALFVDLINKCLFPFALYAFFIVPEKKLLSVFKIITIIVAGFVLFDFISLNTELIPNGKDLTFARYTLLRSEFEGGVGRTGLFLRPNGILGAGKLPHDSANLLAMFSVYWLALSFRKYENNYSAPLLAIFSIVSLLLSQSASNIVAGLLGLLFVLFTYKRSVFSMKSMIKLLLIILSFFSWIYTKYSEELSMLWVWRDRVSIARGDWAGMTYYGQSDVFSNIFSFLFGYGQTLKISEVGYFSEQGFIKQIFEYGILHASIFFLLLSAPVIIYLLNRNQLDKMEVFPYVIAVFIGFLSLWHYGSVLRTTNIFVFFALYGQFARIYVSRSMHYISRPNTVTKGLT